MMTMMRKMLRACALAMCLCAQSGAAEELAKPAADPAALAAARELMEATGTSKQLDSMIDIMSKNFAKGVENDKSKEAGQVKSAVAAIADKFKGYREEMLNDFAQLYAEMFTAAELKEIANFYRSGVGAKYVSNLPNLMQKGSQIGIKYSQRVMQDFGVSGAPVRK